MWRARRRALIILILLSAVFLLVVFPYWVANREVPSCFDAKQNQGEDGVDCGGQCTLLCKDVAKDIKIIWTKMFPVRNGAYDIVAYVENPNFAVGAPKIPYVAKLFDAAGVLIAERNGETFANPNERFAIFAGNMLTGEKIPVRGVIELSSGFAWVKANVPKKVFGVSDKVLVGTNKVPKLSALLVNGEPDIVRNVEVTAVIYDSKGESIAVSGTTVEKLAPKGKENLFFTWSAPFSYIAETEKCETPVDVVLALDRSGSMASDSLHPPQPLSDAKQAAARFVDRLSASDQAAYVSFATTASRPMDQPLTNDVLRLKNAIDRTVIGANGIQYTNIGDVISGAIDELETFRSNENARPFIVLLTDGIPTRPEDPNDLLNKNYPALYARQLADRAKAGGVDIYTIGLGDEVNGDFLVEIATSPEYYYKAVSGADLRAIYQQIATAICKKGPSVIEIIPRVSITAFPTQ
ncbi:MAG: vWA domain-containing protein [Patescibacteria group bacterium]